MKLSTAEILSITALTPFHLRKDDGLGAEHVSTLSRWGDPRWILDGRTKGQDASVRSIVWNFDLPSGTNFMDEAHAPLLDATRRFVWTLFSAPGDGASPLSAGTAGSISTAVRYLITWMTENACRCFADLSAPMLDKYLDDLELEIVNEDSDLESEAQAIVRIRIIYWLWQQRRELAKAGIEALPSRPWPGYTPVDLARMTGAKAARQIPPLPDEVALPILSAAYRMIGVRADDVIRLSRAYFTAYSGATTSLQSIRPREVLESFRFSVIDGSSLPWHAPLSISESFAQAGPAPSLRPVSEMRRLIMDVHDGALIIVQATTGMRISEVAALPAGLDPKTGLPLCVRICLSPSGLHELFVLTSDMSKGNVVPDDAEWVLGMRVQGTNDIPLPVRAIQVLDELLRPWRSMVKSRDLLVRLSNRNGVPRTGSGINPVSSNYIRRRMRKFVVRHVDLSSLPDTSRRAILENDLVPYRATKGSCIKTHQWRKTLAHFVFNTDNSMLPALAQQFQHISVALTEYAYLGRNQALFETFDSVRVQETTAFIYEQMLGRSVLAGRMGKEVEDHIDEIREITKGLDRVQAWRRVFKIVADDGIRLWFAPHGKCMPIDPGEMRCHETAGTASWRNREPNYEAREPALCAGCGCFVLDAQHVPFWERRYVENWSAWRRAERDGTSGQFRVIRQRAEQARSLLAKLQVPTEPLDELVQKELSDAE